MLPAAQVPDGEVAKNEEGQDGEGGGGSSEDLLSRGSGELCFCSAQVPDLSQENRATCRQGRRRGEKKRGAQAGPSPSYSLACLEEREEAPVRL